MTTKSTKSIQKQQEQDAKRAAFRELVMQIDTGLKAEAQAGKEGTYTARLKRIAQTPALAGLMRYSELNQALVLEQCPHATDTDGYIGWQKRGYQVRKGEKALYVVAPHEKKGAEGQEGGENNRQVGFHRQAVFDISQVDPIVQGDQAAAPAAAYDVDAADEEDMKVYEVANPEVGEGEQGAVSDEAAE